MRTGRILLFAALACAAPRAVLAHGGGLDANGGHMDRRTGTYHYHGGGGLVQAPSFGFGGLGTAYSPPSPRRRPRTTARTAPRTEARSTASRQPPLNISVTFGEDGGKDDRSGADTTPTTSTGSSRVPVVRTQTSSEDPEAKAQELLRLAKSLIRQDKIPGALNYLRELTTKYPATEAAKEGARLLKTLTAGGP